jgi:UDP-N-acetylmuramoyl-tripeptide--D-alanyl-D-alanine ligase
MNMEWDEINAQVPLLTLPKMRFEQFEKEGIVFINDAYNANPDSMRAALANLPEPREGGKRIAVLGGMAELGKFSQESHLEMGRFAQKYADHLLTYGEDAVQIAEGFLEAKKPSEHFSDPAALAKALKALLSQGDVVLLKGSRKMQLEKVFEHLFEPSAP